MCQCSLAKYSEELAATETTPLWSIRFCGQNMWIDSFVSSRCFRLNCGAVQQVEEYQH